MKKIYALIAVILLLSVFRCHDIEEPIGCCNNYELVKNIKLTDKDGNWTKYVDFSKIKLFETYANGGFLKDKDEKIYDQIKGVVEARPMYESKIDSIPVHIRLYLMHHLGYDETRYFLLKINDSLYHKIAVNYDKKDSGLKIKSFSYQGDSIFATKNGVLQVLIEESDPDPVPPVSKCEDPDAINDGGELPCEYPPVPKCEDPKAINNGGELPCEYPPPPKCEDPNATNKGEDLPCKYPPPRTHPPFKVSGEFRLSSWMKHIDDNAPISALSIPGTHDSGARRSQEVNISKCQDLDFEQQLNRGIRFLDIRIDSGLDINHGRWYQYENLYKVIEIIERFFQYNPTETVIMSIKQEGTNSSDFASIVEKVINKKPDLWYLGSEIPRMGQVRGKIILFRRYSGSVMGIPMSYWPDNRTFTSGDVSVQDWYDIGGISNENVSKKWKEAKKMIDRAIRREGDYLYINFLSASGGVATPRQYAWGRRPSWGEWWNIVNKSTQGILEHFQYHLKDSFPKGKTYGVIVMDYPDEVILKLLIGTNF